MASKVESGNFPPCEICCRMLHSFMAWESSWSLYQAHMFRLISCCVQEVRAALSFRDLLAELAP